MLPADQLHVLVVEDEPATAQTLAKLLTAWGHSPLVARDGVAALTLIADQRPDVVLLDLGLPRMDGFELARQIRQRWPSRPPVLIAVTGHGTPEDHRQAEQAGIDQHLLKPVDPQELQALLWDCGK
jgi:CheY-like chemotaxis protein